MVDDMDGTVDLSGLLRELVVDRCKLIRKTISGYTDARFSSFIELQGRPDCSGHFQVLLVARCGSIYFLPDIISPLKQTDQQAILNNRESY